MQEISITKEQAEKIKALIKEGQTVTYATIKVLGLDPSSYIQFPDGYWGAGDRVKVS